ncbi:YggS family pyridoxal phosphate-dependent enzyme [Methylocucumis oryzae]|uniref:Pyridoxal phosphate homeostasis protein n=1 Tax=Methylocucumis oryzae TaxID=1632867 RepID=A0A0F3IK18_9GAMM|nr:YggS family pyridoxal phosphate-dependent enzyme [Methylocucumis oryzae]KJV05909.1 alanine racemase [Methylocucumis oryzae]
MIANNLKRLINQISRYEYEAGRQPNSVLLLAVSKTKPASDIIAAYQAGQRHFGENYLQEALQKQRLLGAFDISWHFIGPIQSNKTKLIAQHFAWVHSVDSFKIAQRLSAQRPDGLPPLNVLIQVNISDETSKSGIQLAELPELSQRIMELPNLRLRGVMSIPAPEVDYANQCKPFRQLHSAVTALNQQAFDTFSYGMSGDLKAAIHEGSTLVRIGTALFGARD